MSIVANSAACIRHAYGLGWVITEAALDSVIKYEGLRVVRLPAFSSVREYQLGDIVAVRAGETQPWRLWLKAHALGHFVLHRNDRLHDCESIVIARQEHQADMFAGYLLLGKSWRGQEVWEMAEECGVPEECVEKWVCEAWAMGNWAVGW